jgi:hypothetical protein
MIVRTSFIAEIFPVWPWDISIASTTMWNNELIKKLEFAKCALATNYDRNEY